MVAITVVQGSEVPGSQKGAQSLEEFVELLQSITELGKQITGMQRPADLPPPGQSLPPEMELEPEVASLCNPSTHSCHAASLAFLSSDWSHPWGTELATCYAVNRSCMALPAEDRTVQWKSRGCRAGRRDEPLV